MSDGTSPRPPSRQGSLAEMAARAAKRTTTRAVAPSSPDVAPLKQEAASVNGAAPLTSGSGLINCMRSLKKIGSRLRSPTQLQPRNQLTFRKTPGLRSANEARASRSSVTQVSHWGSWRSGLSRCAGRVRLRASHRTSRQRRRLSRTVQPPRTAGAMSYHQPLRLRRQPNERARSNRQSTVRAESRIRRERRQAARRSNRARAWTDP